MAVVAAVLAAVGDDGSDPVGLIGVPRMRAGVVDLHPATGTFRARSPRRVRVGSLGGFRTWPLWTQGPVRLAPAPAASSLRMQPGTSGGANGAILFMGVLE